MNVFSLHYIIAINSAACELALNQNAANGLLEVSHVVVIFKVPSSKEFT